MVSRSKFIRVELTGVDNLIAGVRTIADVDKYRPQVNALIDGKMKMQVRQTFNKMSDPSTGMPWKPVRPFGEADPSHSILQSTGRLIQALTTAPLKSLGDEVWLAAPDSVRYANIHQFGGVIKPTSSKYLAIPITKSAKRAGRARRWWGQQQTKAKPFVYKAKTGKQNLFIAKAGRGGKLTLHWLLLEQVTMPARPYLGWNDEYADEVGRTVLDYVALKARQEGFTVE